MSDSIGILGDIGHTIKQANQNRITCFAWAKNVQIVKMKTYIQPKSEHSFSTMETIGVTNIWSVYSTRQGQRRINDKLASVLKHIIKRHKISLKLLVTYHCFNYFDLFRSISSKHTAGTDAIITPWQICARYISTLYSVYNVGLDQYTGFVCINSHGSYWNFYNKAIKQ